MSKKIMKKWGIGAVTGVLVLGSLTPIIQPYTTVSAAENTIKQLKASGEGSVSDVMFEDLNGNAVQDSNETTGIAGIKVELYNDQGTLIGTATTGTDGRYTFSNVPDGTYYLHVDMSTLPTDEKLSQHKASTVQMVTQAISPFLVAMPLQVIILASIQNKVLFKALCIMTPMETA
ncbi:hypothetical protein HCA64_01795 [Listeria booriae]|uniref:SdrD B-like domain-containing protein n=1 Tax=Listeria booriae TaxID=1552123 RepID=UPI001625AF25|nr:SdrD B-like domain-containing protein [Listeria booriae]MBC1905200.1 hypothetical protein [Listeria booriae]